MNMSMQLCTYPLQFNLMISCKTGFHFSKKGGVGFYFIQFILVLHQYHDSNISEIQMHINVTYYKYIIQSAKTNNVDSIMCKLFRS